MNREEFERLNPEDLTSRMLTDPASIDSVIQGLSHPVGRIKFGCAKSLVVLSEKYPALLLPKSACITRFLDSENQILKWNAIMISGNLGLREVLPRLYKFLSCGELITANNAIASLAKIGREYPEKRRQIVSKLLEVERADFDTGECRNIAIGKVLEALSSLLNASSVNEEAVAFARRQTSNTRNATAKKAANFLKKVQGSRFNPEP